MNSFRDIWRGIASWLAVYLRRFRSDDLPEARASATMNYLRTSQRNRSKIHRDPRQFVFICGTARSGTTMMAELFQSHPHVAMGRERYAHLIKSREPFTMDLFDRDRFCRDLRSGDTHHHKLQPYYATLYPRYDLCTHVGDKLPNLFENYPKILASFPKAKLLYMLRNPFHVAQSFELRAEETRRLGGGGWPEWRGWKKAIEEWNASLSATLALNGSLDCLVVLYENLFVDSGVLGSLLGFLDLAPTPEIYERWHMSARNAEKLELARTLRLDSVQMLYIMRNARFDLYQEIICRHALSVGEQLGSHGRNMVARSIQ